MATKTRKRKSTGSKQRFIGKPNGQIQERVRAVGPEQFGIVSVDCAKRRSKWMLCNFYGKVLVEPTTVEHTTGGLWAMTQRVSEACQTHGLTDSIIAVEIGGRQMWRGRGVDREYLLLKLQEFHRVHHTPTAQTICDLNEAFAWLPKSEHAAEAKPLAELVRQKRRGPQRIGDLLIPLLIRLGLSREDLGVAAEQTIESPTSEARSSS